MHSLHSLYQILHLPERWAMLQGGCMLSAAAILLFVLWRLSKAEQDKVNPAELLTCLCLSIIAGSFPYLLLAEINADETMALNAARLYAQDFIPFRGADNLTVGPLNVWHLVGLNKLGMPLNYLSLRLCGLLLFKLPSLILLFQIAKLLSNTYSALLALWMLAAFEALTANADFISYNAELPAVLIILTVLYGYLSKKINPILQGILLGSLLWIKFQTLPMAALLFVAIILSNNAKALPKLIFGALLPSALVIGLSFAGGALPDLWQRYFINNLFYAVASPVAAESGQAFKSISYLLNMPLCRMFPWVLVLSFLALSRVPRLSIKSSLFKRNDFLAGAMLVVAIVSAVLPMTFFHHYQRFIYPYLIILSAIGISGINHKDFRKAIIISCVAVFLPWACYDAVKSELSVNRIISSSENSDFFHSVPHPASSLIKKYTSEGDRILVWGWPAKIYLETETLPASRDVLPFYQMYPSAQQDYYMRAMLADFKAHPPKIIADVTSVSEYYFNEAKYGIRQYPDLSEYLNTTYQMVDSSSSVKIYVMLSGKSSN